MTKVETFADQLVTLTVTELIDLKKVLKDKYGLEINEAMAPIAAKEEVAVVKEKTTFTVMLKKDKLDETAVKMATIRLVKAITGQTLPEAKALVESAPIAVKENIGQSEAQGIADQLTTAGATVELV
jgi:large subunit ribosomal protein L7/L12